MKSTIDIFKNISTNHKKRVCTNIHTGTSPKMEDIMVHRINKIKK